MKSHVLVTLADKNYVNQAKQLFSSAYWNGGWDGDYLLFSYNIPEKELKWFRKKGIFIYKCKKTYNEKKIKINQFNKDYIYPIYLCKFYLFTDYFKKWENIVFLDSDIIVKASIKRLKNVQGIFFVKDLSPKLFQHFIEKKYIKDLEEKLVFNNLIKNYSIRENALNSGVIAFSSDIIIPGAFEKLLKFYDFYRNIIIFPEQAVFNLYFYKKWKKLPAVYNAYSFFFSRDEKINAIILHTIMKDKAWYETSRFKKEWDENLKKAEFIDIQNPKNPEKTFSREEIILNSNKIEKKMLGIPLSNKIEKIFGIMGIYLKKICPRLYFLKKKIEFRFKKFI